MWLPGKTGPSGSCCLSHCTSSRSPQSLGPSHALSTLRPVPPCYAAATSSGLLAFLLWRAQLGHHCLRRPPSLPKPPLITGRAPRALRRGNFPVCLSPTLPLRIRLLGSGTSSVHGLVLNTHPIEPGTPQESARAHTGPGTHRRSMNIGGRTEDLRAPSLCTPTRGPLLLCSPPTPT